MRLYSPLLFPIIYHRIDRLSSAIYSTFAANGLRIIPNKRSLRLANRPLRKQPHEQTRGYFYRISADEEYVSGGSLLVLHIVLSSMCTVQRWGWGIFQQAANNQQSLCFTYLFIVFSYPTAARYTPNIQWRTRLDLNQECQIQILECYRYTTGP